MRVALRLGAFVPAFLLALAACDVATNEAGPPNVLRIEPRPALPDTAALPLALPTGNLGLLTGNLPGFYMEVERDTVSGLREAGWEAGQYGLVRGPVVTDAGPRFTQLHEGLDIRPQFRDAQGEPLDTVRAARRGAVVYVNQSVGSAFGRYVVLRHDWDGVPVYTLYAHLDSVGVREGQRVGRREPLGRLGYTGRGIWRARAHVHFEVAMLLNEHEKSWFDRYYGGRNDQHGLYFGTNLAGVDVPALFEAMAEDPSLSFRDFVKGQPAGYTVALPGDRPLDLLRRYPWLWEGETPPRADPPGAWLVTFTQEGVPIRIEHRREPVARPEVVGVSREIERGRLGTNGVLAWTGDRYVLTGVGLRYLSLVATTAAGPAPW